MSDVLARALCWSFGDHMSFLTFETSAQQAQGCCSQHQRATTSVLQGGPMRQCTAGRTHAAVYCSADPCSSVLQCRPMQQCTAVQTYAAVYCSADPCSSVLQCRPILRHASKHHLLVRPQLRRNDPQRPPLLRQRSEHHVRVRSHLLRGVLKRATVLRHSNEHHHLVGFAHRRD